MIASLERLHILPDSQYIYRVLLRKKYTEQFPHGLENRSTEAAEAQKETAALCLSRSKRMGFESY